MPLKSSTLLMAGIAFTFGMLLGLLLQLPGVALPHSDTAQIANTHGAMAGVHTFHKRAIKTVGAANENAFDIPFIREQGRKIPAALLNSPNSAPMDERKENSGHNARLTNRADPKYTSGLVEDPQNNHLEVEAKKEEVHPDTYHKKRQDDLIYESEESIPVFADVDSARQSVIISSQDQKPVKPHGRQPSLEKPLLIDGHLLNNISLTLANRVIVENINDVVKGIYWSDRLEKVTPRFHDLEIENWKKFARNTKIVKLEEGCGRMQNRLATFIDATKACIRYRINTDQIQGEIFSYYLSKLLKIKNLPPSILGMVNSNKQQWEGVLKEIVLSHWYPDKVFVISQWINDLSPAYIPTDFREESRKLTPTKGVLKNKTVSELIELVQWSDLIVLDYLTANLDRVVNNMFNRQWNAHIMEGPAHNLEKSTRTGLLTFFDNESGLFHGYRLLDKYSHFHETLLNSLCIFRRSTAEIIEDLHENGDVSERLSAIFLLEEPDLQKWLPKIPQQNIKILKSRISDVYSRIQKCRAEYGG
ncbi:four-jointed box protein 1 [Lingula anatina]|uniref:Four-jointed box protein 1 n=1 Tax=Lingula anatina TaxID=7574 RepID=A0A1S3J0J1_LINAN|nr:four-jointed box protein 1 [Lingula anatina]XP_013403844.1 four-jointed box protein 1 [Lingula anatina]XP_013403932.1 four-jointed box protein 1 [Lingula anatina]|eukprot:XP_013403766.1 four-jointed box protein 1 [Lingula anatina]